MGKHLCEKCKLKEKFEQAPRSLIGKFWRWHINFCPGWRGYYNSLSDEQRKDIFDKYGFKR